MATKRSSSKTKKNVPPKRRGRKPKKIIENDYNSDAEYNNLSENNEPTVILSLKVDPTKLIDINKTNQKKLKNIVNVDSSESSSSENIFSNDIPDDKTCNKCISSEKTIRILQKKLEKYEAKDVISKSSKIHYNNINLALYDTKKKINVKQVNNIKCWWDCNYFTGIPCFLPELYHNGIYYVIGCFCSFNCALAYNLFYLKDSKIYIRISLIYKIYREIYKIPPNEEIKIKEALPRELLEDFGGSMTLITFRELSKNIDKEYVKFYPPIKSINLVIEERTLDTNNNTSDSDLVIKRPKPIVKKNKICFSKSSK